MEEKYVLLFKRNGWQFCEICPESELAKNIKMIENCQVYKVTQEIKGVNDGKNS